LTASVSEPRNPGTGAYGYVVYDSSGKLAEGNDVVGDNVSNNYAEYSALVAALNELLHRGLTKDVTVKSDSKLLVYQMSGRWKRKKGGYLEKYKEASELAKKFERLTFVWIPREENSEADLLSRVAYERYRRSKGLPVRFSH